MVSHNLHRRHLTEPQRAMVASKLAKLGAHRPPETVGIPTVTRGKTQPEAANLLNVSRDSVTQARKIDREGIPELSEAVMSGGVSLAAAVDVAKLPEDEQREVVAAGPDAIKAKAKEIREETKMPSKPENPTPKGRIKITHEDGTARSIFRDSRNSAMRR